MGQLKSAKREVAKRRAQGKAVDIVRVKERKDGGIVREYMAGDLK